MKRKSAPTVLTGRQQSGVVLLITLIMLGIFSIIVISMVVGSNTNFKIAGNQQFRMEAKVTAQQAIEAYISNAANFGLTLPTTPAVFAIDFDGDGTDDMQAVVQPPVCLRSEPVSADSLNVNSEEDKQCFKSGKPTASGQISASGSNSVAGSYCEKLTYDVQADVDDTKTSAAIELHQGVYQRVVVGTDCS